MPWPNPEQGICRVCPEFVKEAIMGKERNMKRYPDLASFRPDMAEQWHPTKNGRLSPRDVTARSGRKVWWVCPEGHEWQATVASRSTGGGCPICSGKKVLKGYNDLATAAPELASQWHPVKNGALGPDGVTKGSGKKVWWVCEKGHEWQAVISSRSAGCGCPQCNPSTSFAEQALYFYIGQRCQAENRYRFMKKELDIYLPEFRIAVEHDGPCHLRKRVRQADARKDALLRENGVHLIRVKDPFPFSVDEERSIIYYTYDENRREDLERAIRETLRLISRRTGRDLETDIDVNRDETAIRDRYKAYELERSIFAKVSEAKAYWDWERNTLNPLYLTWGSLKKVHWKCGYGHQWTGSASDFARGGRCPVCQGRRVLAGFNDLATADPALAGEWHPSKNSGLSPEQVTAHSGKRVWWLCQNGHSWKSAISNRADGCGCPYCSGRRAVRGYNDFLTLHPELASEWDYEKNTGIYPFDVLEYSNQKVWWKCSKGHGWKAAICNRTAGHGCPICAGRQVLAGDNDLQALRPELAAQWHPEKNGDLTPRQITVGSKRKVWWLCQKGHEWRATVANRVWGTGCPICSNRKVAPGVNDLVSAHPELIAQWHREKNGALRPEHMAKTSRTKVWWICEQGHQWQASVGDRSRGYGCPYCSGKLPIPGVNDLAAAAPELAAEWHPEKNGSLTPRDVKLHSNRKVWWRCQKGHEWQATVNSRASGSGCALCSGRRAQAGVTDLATTHPQLAREWVIGKNPGITPRDVTQGSEQKIWWRCQKGHEWQTAIYNRVRGSGCPVCSGHKVMEGYNDLATARADLAQEWHPTRNRADMTPRTLSPGSHYKAWWKCGLGHEWQASVSNRVQGAGCPFCTGRRVLQGFNDLAALRPELAAQWHPDKNGELTPQELTQHSGRKVWWRCEQGHEWQASVDARSRGTGCPICAGKRRPAPGTGASPA